MKYREIIFRSYRSTGYASTYTDTSENKEAIGESYHREFGEFLPSDKQARILDLGCGSGYLVRWLLELGYQNVLGVDCSPEQVAYALKLNLPVVHGDALSFLSRNRKFDLVVATDVIEHMTKDEIIDFLAAIHQALNPGGRLILRTGNTSSIYGAHSRYIDFTHEIGFNEISMRQLLMAMGYQQIRVSDSKIPFGLRPKRLVRWLLFRAWRSFYNFVLLLEVGQDRPRLLGKLLIACATKPTV